MATARPESLTLGKLLKLVMQNGITSQIAHHAQAWDFIKKQKKSAGEGKAIEFALETDLGISSVGFIPVDQNAFLAPVAGSEILGTAYTKDMSLSLSVRRSLIERAKSDFASYGKPLAIELDRKTKGMSMLLASSLYQDGTGVIGQVDASSSIVSGKLKLQIAKNTSSADVKGYIGWFFKGDLIAIRTSALAAHNATDVTPTSAAYYKIESIDRFASAPYVILTGYDASGNELTLTSVGTVVAGDYVYRKTVAAESGLIGISSISSSVDYSSVSSNWNGLETYMNLAGTTKIHGISLDSNIGLTKVDCGSALQPEDFEDLIGRAVINNGLGKYKYSKALMSFETYKSLAGIIATNRSFTMFQDQKLGQPQLMYTSGNVSIKFEQDVYVPDSRIWVLPEGDAIEYHGTDFELVKNGNNAEHLGMVTVGSDIRHANEINMYMYGRGCLIVKHPASIGVIHGF